MKSVACLELPGGGRVIAEAAEPRTGIMDWRVFYDEHWPWIYRLVRRLAGPGVDSEDATQDVFLAIFRKLPSFEGRAALKAWIYRVCLNVVSEHRRRAHRRRRLENALALLGLGKTERRTPATAAETQSDLELLQRSLHAMDEREREVFVLREIQGLGGPEIAEILGISADNVRARLVRARREFQRIVAGGKNRNEEV